MTKNHEKKSTMDEAISDSSGVVSSNVFAAVAGDSAPADRGGEGGADGGEAAVAPSPASSPSTQKRQQRRRRRLRRQLPTVTTLQYTLSLDVEKSKFFHANYALLEGEIMAVEAQMETHLGDDGSSNGELDNHHADDVDHFNAPQPPRPPSSTPFLNDLELRRGQRCFVIVKQNVNRLYQSLVPSSLEAERKRNGTSIDTPWATGWLRHEMYGLVTRVRLPPLRVTMVTTEMTQDEEGEENCGDGLPDSENHGLIQKFPRMPPVSAIRNKNGTKSLDFDSEFLGVFDPHQDEKDNSQRHGEAYSADQDDILTINQCDLSRRRTRHKHFAKWLVHTFGKSRLNSGSGVLDVAGGNGKVSTALHKLGVRSTILDPKPIGERIDNIRIIPVSLKGDGSHLTDINDLEITLQKTECNGTSRSDSFLAPTEYAEVVRNCSIIVGLHPDEAAEPLVLMALRLGKPFAVSPCCVVSKAFPNRRRRATGELVRTTWDLCRYILDLSPKKENTSLSSSSSSASSTFEVELLPFAGRNKVIFWRGGAVGGATTPLDDMYCQEISASSLEAHINIPTHLSPPNEVDRGNKKKARI